MQGNKYTEVLWGNNINRVKQQVHTTKTFFTQAFKQTLHDISWHQFNHWVNKCSLTVSMIPLCSARLLFGFNSRPTF